MIKTYYNVQEFARVMRVSDNTVRLAIKKGRINAFRVGAGKKSHFRIPHSEIERIQLIGHVDFEQGI